MHLFRIENAEGDGPYRGGAESIGLDTYADDHHPTHGSLPHHLSCNEMNLRFAFSSLDQLKSWFYVGELRTMQRHGFLLTEWEVDHRAAWSGRKQWAFDATRAERLSAVPLDPEAL